MVIGLALVLLVAGAGGIAWRLLGSAGHGDDLTALAEREAAAPVLPVAADRAAALEFPRRDGGGWLVEERRLPAGGRPDRDLLAVMTALCDGPRSGRAVSALPRGTRALAAFLDAERGVAVVDFSGELVLRHPGGSAAEAATLGTILRTLAANFPQVATCTILVEGRQPSTLGGHLDLSRPLAPRRWR
ncbi:GerMN domain-containing protein [bacterium]|nr:GerMN domain-containing protein [bacterium]